MWAMFGGKVFVWAALPWLCLGWGGGAANETETAERG